MSAWGAKSSKPAALVVGGADAAPAEEAPYRPQPGSKEVVIEGLALLRIVKHCSEALPAYAKGSILGLDDPSTGALEVTNAFGTSSGSDGADDDGHAENKTNEYVEAMLRNLREYNIDNNNVGWYQAVNLGSSLNLYDDLLIQYSYQTALPASVCIMFDPVQTMRGNLILRAYRLSDRFMELMHFNGGGKPFPFMPPGDIWEVLPVRVRNSGLVQAYLASLDRGAADCAFDRLDLSTQPFLEKHLEELSTWIDDLCEQQKVFHRYVHRGTQQYPSGAVMKSGTPFKPFAVTSSSLPSTHWVETVWHATSLDVLAPAQPARHPPRREDCDADAPLRSPSHGPTGTRGTSTARSRSCRRAAAAARAPRPATTRRWWPTPGASSTSSCPTRWTATAGRCRTSPASASRRCSCPPRCAPARTTREPLRCGSAAAEAGGGPRCRTNEANDAVIDSLRGKGRSGGCATRPRGAECIVWYLADEIWYLADVIWYLADVVWYLWPPVRGRTAPRGRPGAAGGCRGRLPGVLGRRTPHICMYGHALLPHVHICTSSSHPRCASARGRGGQDPRGTGPAAGSTFEG